MRSVILGATNALTIPEENSCRGESSSREVDFLLKSENSTMKIFKLFSIIE